MHANIVTLYFRCRNRSSSTVPNSAFTRPDPKITKILDSVAFSDDGHSKLSRDFDGNLHFVSTKPPLLTKPCKNSRKTDDFEAAAFGGLGGPLFASIGFEFSEILPEAKDGQHVRISKRKCNSVARMYQPLVLGDKNYPYDDTQASAHRMHVPHFCTWWASS